jgi:hypothetical protein
MELGAAVELATASAPHLFLPLACAANVAKVGLAFLLNDICHIHTQLCLKRK